MKVREVLVVEGKNDETRLKQIMNVDVITTGGSFVTNKKLELIKKVNEVRGVIVFTDQDNKGEQIRQKIVSYIGECKHAHLNKNKTFIRGKIGVEKAKRDEILDILQDKISYFEREGLTIDDFYNLGLIGKEDSKEKRDIVSDYLGIDKYNAKSLLKVINMLNIDIVKLKEVLNNG